MFHVEHFLGNMNFCCRKNFCWVWGCKNSPFLYCTCRYDHLQSRTGVRYPHFATKNMRTDAPAAIEALPPSHRRFFCEDRSLTTVLLYKSVIAPLPFSLNRAVFKPCLNAVVFLFFCQSTSGQCLSAHGTVVKRPSFARIAAVRRRTKLTAESDSVNEEDLP